MNKTIEGIILASEDYREYDVILKVLTSENGLQSLVAKGIRKISSKNAAVCQRFAHARFYIDYKEGQTIHGMRTADLLNSFRHLREDLQKQSIASVLCDLILSFYHDDEFNLYHDLLFTFEKMEQSNQPYAAASMFLVHLLDVQGMKPVVDACVHCGSTNHICSFSASDGGFICTNCFHLGLSKETQKDLKCFRLLVLCEQEHYDIVETYTNWNFHHFESFYKFFEEYSDIYLKSMKFLRYIEEMNTASQSKPNI